MLFLSSRISTCCKPHIVCEMSKASPDFLSINNPFVALFFSLGFEGRQELWLITQVPENTRTELDVRVRADDSEERVVLYRATFESKGGRLVSLWKTGG